MTENFPNVTECRTRPGYDTDEPTTINCKVHSENVTGPLHQHKDTICTNTSICVKKRSVLCTTSLTGVCHALSSKIPQTLFKPILC